MKPSFEDLITGLTEAPTPEEFAGIPYHDRSKMKRQVLGVFIPRGTSPHAMMIDQGSGIVGVPFNNGAGLLVYYEGNRYGASNMNTWEERVKNAAGRLIPRYPTVAMSFLQKDLVDLVRVGTIDNNYKLTVDPAFEAAIESYAGTPLYEVAPPPRRSARP